MLIKTTQYVCDGCGKAWEVTTQKLAVGVPEAVISPDWSELVVMHNHHLCFTCAVKDFKEHSDGI